MHEDPQVLHFGKWGRGQRLVENMVITIEPMVNVGDWQMYIEDNGWVAKTKDGSRSCQFEHQLVVGKDKAEILTNQDNYSLSEDELLWIENYKF